MSKTLSAEAEHRPYFTTKRMALIGVMTAVTCILDRSRFRFHSARFRFPLQTLLFIWRHMCWE